MDNEKYFLHDWEKNNIYPKRKKDTLAQLTIETVLNLRCFLIDKKVNGFRDEVKENQLDKNNLEEVINYSKLKKLIIRKVKQSFMILIPLEFYKLEYQSFYVC